VSMDRQMYKEDVYTHTHAHMCVHTHAPTHTCPERVRVLCVWTPRLALVQGSTVLPPFLALLSGVWQMKGVFTRS